MSTNNPSPILTNHAMLVAWGIYARQIGLVEAIEAVRLHQKKREHRPQTKVIEFLVALLAGGASSLVAEGNEEAVAALADEVNQ